METNMMCSTRGFNRIFSSTLVAMGFSLLLIGAGKAPPTAETAKTTKAPGKSSAISFVSKKIDNGLEVVLMPSSKVPLVTIVLVAKAGAMTETREINGLTHLWEHMFFKGNARLPDQEAFNRRIRELGITYNGDTSAETVRYYFTMPAVHLDDGLQFMADAISTPLLEQTELEKERHVVLDEYDRNASHPSFDMRNLSRRIIYGDLDYRRDPLGQRPLIEKATREQLLRIRDEVFVPQNCALFVSGDFDVEKIMPMVAKHFSAWKAPKDWTPVKRPEFQPFPPTIEFVMTRPLVRDATIDITFDGPKARQSPEDTFAADFLINLLEHRSGKFYKKFDDSGLTFETDMSYHTQSEAGEISVVAKTKPENIAKVREALLAEINEWAKPDYFTKTQFDDVRRRLIIGHKFELNQLSSFIKSLGFWWSVTGLDYYAGYLNDMQKVDLKQVQGFVKKYLIGKPYVMTTLLSPEDAKAINLEDNSKPLVEKYLSDYKKVSQASLK